MTEHPATPPDEPQRIFVATPGRTVSYNLEGGIVRPALIIGVEEELQAVNLLVFLSADDANRLPEELGDDVDHVTEHQGAIVGASPGTWFPPPVITADGDTLDWNSVWFLPAAVPETQETP